MSKQRPAANELTAGQEDELFRGGHALASVERQINALRDAYETLRTSGKASDNELVRAKDTLDRKIEKLTGSNKGVGNLEQWEKEVERVSKATLRYSQSELEEAAATIVLQTKNIGLTFDEQAKVFARLPDLVAGSGQELTVAAGEVKGEHNERIA